MALVLMAVVALLGLVAMSWVVLLALSWGLARAAEARRSTPGQDQSDQG